MTPTHSRHCAGKVAANDGSEERERLNMYQPKTGEKCSCTAGIERDNCPKCEGTGMVIDFAAIRARNQRSNQARRERNQAMKDLGLVRVRGALGGTYWE